MNQESSILEFKEQLTNSFLKTVSAYANYHGGTVLFGVCDNGQAVGLDNPKQACLDIENKINDSISPQPDYSLIINDSNCTVELKVKPGKSKPYYFKGKAYRRNDTSAIEVDRLELSRLLLEGSNKTFEELPAERQDLQFNALGKAMTSRLSLHSFSSDALKTLGLLDKDGLYNNAAALLADENDFHGIDVAVFGESINIIRQRNTLDRRCVLRQIDEAMAMFDAQYCYEEIEGLYRKKREMIPRESFREAVTNAVVHRTWDMPAHIRVAMFNDRIEITSPGGLPAGLTTEEFLADKVSVRRNRILAEVFLRLGLIEAFGTGITRIKESYSDSRRKPTFSVTQNAVAITLPIVSKELGLTPDQELIYTMLSSTMALSTNELVASSGFSKSKVIRILRDLIEKGLVVSTNLGRATKYLKAYHPFSNTSV